MTSSVSSTATQVSSEVGGTGLCTTTRTRSRSLNDLPGGLRVAVLKRPERLKPRIQATLAGLEELRFLKEQHQNLVDEAKFGLKARSASNSDMQDLFVKQTYEWLSSCRDRLSASNLERINEESGKEEKNLAAFEHSNLDRKSSDLNQATSYRHKIKRPMSVSGYPTLEQSRKSAECCPDYKPTRQQSVRTSQSENKKPVQPEKFSTMRRASFQCHAVLTRQKERIPTLSTSHEYPSPMHAVMRQYQPKIGDDKLKNDKKVSMNSNLTVNRQSEPIGDATGVTIMRRSSFTARSTSWSGDQKSPTNDSSSLTRYKSGQEIASSYKNIDSPSHGSLVRDELSKKHIKETNKTNVKRSISDKEYMGKICRDSGGLRQERSDQKCGKESKAEDVKDSSQTCIRTPPMTGVNVSLNPTNNQQQHLRQQGDNSKDKPFRKNPSKPEKYSEYQNLKDLERGKIWKTETVPTKNTKPTDNNQNRSPTQLSRTERNRNLQNHLKGDSCSYTSDEGYCASLSSIPRGRRQLSIQSDVSWMSADIDDNRSCDSNVALSDDRGRSTGHVVAQGTHVQKLDRKPSFSRCQNSILTPNNEALQASKVLPFRQTSL